MDIYSQKGIKYSFNSPHFINHIYGCDANGNMQSDMIIGSGNKIYGYGYCRYVSEELIYEISMSDYKIYLRNKQIDSLLI